MRAARDPAPVAGARSHMCRLLLSCLASKQVRASDDIDLRHGKALLSQLFGVLPWLCVKTLVPPVISTQSLRYSIKHTSSSSTLFSCDDTSLASDIMKFSLAALATVALAAQGAIADGWFGSAGKSHSINVAQGLICDLRISISNAGSLTSRSRSIQQVARNRA